LSSPLPRCCRRRLLQQNRSTDDIANLLWYQFNSFAPQGIGNLMFTNLSSRRGPFLLFVFLMALSAGRAFANDAQVWAALGQGGKVVLLRHTHVDMREGIGHLAPETARRRAETFVAHETPPTLQAADREPTKLAVFAFELEDTSAAVHSIGESAVDAADAAELTRVTDAVRQMLAQSPHYRVIDVGGADADAVKAHVLHDCGGCDAGIALGLGADQSLVGVIRRVSRTEYTIRFQVREARTGAVVASADSGLRMGANYSWTRGAVRLISDRLLETQSQQ
jgi:hypothetical protein